MKVFLPLLLAALLGAEQAHSLVRFSCTNQQGNSYCLRPTVCEDTDNYCVTVHAAAGIGNVADFGYSLHKGRSPICPRRLAPLPELPVQLQQRPRAAGQPRPAGPPAAAQPAGPAPDP